MNRSIGKYRDEESIEYISEREKKRKNSALEMHRNSQCVFSFNGKRKKS